MGFLSTIKETFAGGGAGGVVKGANEILKSIDGLNTSEDEKAEHRKSVIETVVQAQSAVLVAEATSESWLASNWRPLLATMWGCIVTYTFFFGPMFGLPIVPLPPELWSLLTLMIGGYAGGRSVEKLAKIVMPNMKMARLKKKMMKKFSAEEIKELLDD